MKTKSILTDMKILRVLAIFLVVLGHSASVYRPGWVFQSKIISPFFNNVVDIISLFNMPLFVFISGVIYCYCKKEKN